MTLASRDYPGRLGNYSGSNGECQDDGFHSVVIVSANRLRRSQRSLRRKLTSTFVPTISGHGAVSSITILRDVDVRTRAQSSCAKAAVCDHQRDLGHLADEIAIRKCDRTHDDRLPGLLAILRNARLARLPIRATSLSARPPLSTLVSLSPIRSAMHPAFQVPLNSSRRGDLCAPGR